MTGVENLAAVILAFFIVTVSPGPANLAVATVAMRSGRHCGLRFAAGLALGLAFWGLVAASGLGTILQTSATLLTTLKLVGAAYLLWLAYQSARAAFAPTHSTEAHIAIGERWFWRGLILNLSNPKAVVAWMAALSMGLGTNDAGAGLMTATLICMAVGALNYVGHAILFSLSGIMSGYKRVRRYIDGASAVLFAGAGLGLLRSTLSR